MNTFNALEVLQGIYEMNRDMAADGNHVAPLKDQEYYVHYLVDIIEMDESESIKGASILKALAPAYIRKNELTTIQFNDHAVYITPNGEAPYSLDYPDSLIDEEDLDAFRIGLSTLYPDAFYI